MNSLPDDFDATVSGNNDSGTSTSVWVNGVTRAEISFSLGLGTEGQITVKIKDDSGTQVYEETLSGQSAISSITATTAVGLPGNWEVRIKATDLNGTASISLTRL